MRLLIPQGVRGVVKLKPILKNYQIITTIVIHTYVAPILQTQKL